MTYIKVYLDWQNALEPLSDEEVGRLFRALLSYGETGEKMDLQGNERFIYPILVNSINADNAVYERVCEQNRANGKLGGRPKKENPAVLEKTERFSEKPKETEWFSEKPKETQKSQEKKRKDKTRQDKIIIGEKSTRFSPPTLTEIKSYCQERNNGVDPQRFFDFYQAKGWMVGKNKMKDWKAAVRTWERDKPKQRASYDLSELDRLGLEIPEI